MFGKDKVKGHNRIIKGKSGFKVTRIGDFLRKKDDNRKRNIAIGTAAVLGAGGVALLLRKKGVKISNLLKKSTKVPLKNTTVVPKNVVSKVEDIKPSISNNASSNNGFSKADLEKYKRPVVEPRPVVNIQPKKTSTSAPSQTDKVVTIKKDFDPLPDPWDTPISKPKMRSAKLLVKKPTTQNRLRRKDSIPDPWDSPTKYNLKKESSELLVKKEGVKLLTTPLTSKSRDNLLRSKGTTVKERVISRLVDGYATLPLPMKVTLQMEKALVKPRVLSNVGRPPDTKGLKVILDEGNKTPLDKVISKAKRKVGDRLKRESGIAEQRAADVKKN